MVSTASSSGNQRAHNQRGPNRETTNQRATADQEAGNFTTPATTSASPSTTSRLQLVHGSAGDHPLVQLFLQGYQQAPGASEFVAQLENPTYEPTDRLLIKSGQHVVGHARHAARQLRFDGEWLAVTLLEEYVAAPELHAGEAHVALLRAAEQLARREGSVLALTWTREPDFLCRQQWVSLGNRGFSEAAPREILAHLNASATATEDSDSLVLLNPPTSSIQIRIWRHIELDDVKRLYLEYIDEIPGALDRNDAYWHWLICRRGYDRIYTAVEIHPASAERASDERLVGYAALREGRLVELVCQQEEARNQLLSRICGDAIERDHHTICVDAPLDESIHDLFRAAGGSYRTRSQGPTLMVRLFDPAAFLEGLRPRLWRRAKAAPLARQSELGLLVEGEKWQLVMGARAVKLVPGKLGRSYLNLSREQFVKLLLGQLDISRPPESEIGSTRVALELAAALFPYQPLWLPPWDELPAI